jgi:hypothetical protein
MDHEDAAEPQLHYGIFAEPGAYPYPFGSECVGWLDTVDDAVLQGLPFGRLRDQAVSVDAVFEHFRGRYCELEAVAGAQGMTAYIAQNLAALKGSLLRLHAQRRRLRRLLTAYHQPRWGAQWN